MERKVINLKTKQGVKTPSVNPMKLFLSRFYFLTKSNFKKIITVIYEEIS